MRMRFKSSTIIDRRMKQHGQPAEQPHPGEILKQQFLEEIGMSQNQLAHAIGVPPNRIHDIVRGRRSITPDTDLRLSRLFGSLKGYWLRLDNTYEPTKARRGLGPTIEKIRAGGLV
jgi:antitoxin HigA-1